MRVGQIIIADAQRAGRRQGRGTGFHDRFRGGIACANLDFRPIIAARYRDSHGFGIGRVAVIRGDRKGQNDAFAVGEVVKRFRTAVKAPGELARGIARTGGQRAARRNGQHALQCRIVASIGVQRSRRRNRADGDGNLIPRVHVGQGQRAAGRQVRHIGFLDGLRLGIPRFNRDDRRVIGARHVDGHVRFRIAAQPIGHAHGEHIRHRSPTGQRLGVLIGVVQCIGPRPAVIQRQAAIGAFHHGG